MFTRSGSGSEFDSVIMVEGSLSRPDTDGEMLAEVVVMYLNHKTGVSYGSCKVTKSLFSKKTVELLNQLTESIEEDFGNIAFGEGIVTSQSGAVQALGSAEDPTGGIDPKSLGGV